MKRTAQDKNTRDDNRRLTAESSERLVGFQNAGKVGRDHDHHTHYGASDPLSNKQEQRNDENSEKPKLRVTQVCERSFSPEWGRLMGKPPQVLQRCLRKKGVEV